MPSRHENHVGEMPAYDAKKLLEQCGDDQALVDDLIEIFLDSHEEMIAAIAESIQHESQEQAAKAAHKIKGSLNVLHAEEACLEAVKLEKMILEGQSNPVVREQFAKLREKVRILVSQMEPRQL